MENYDVSEELHSPNYILYILLGIVLIVVGKVDESTISVYLGFASLTAAIVSLMRPIVVYLVKRSARRASQRKEQKSKSSGSSGSPRRRKKRTAFFLRRVQKSLRTSLVA